MQFVAHFSPVVALFLKNWTDLMKMFDKIQRKTALESHRRRRGYQILKIVNNIFKDQ